MINYKYPNKSSKRKKKILYDDGGDLAQNMLNSQSLQTNQMNPMSAVGDLINSATQFTKPYSPERNEEIGKGIGSAVGTAAGMGLGALGIPPQIAIPIASGLFGAAGSWIGGQIAPNKINLSALNQSTVIPTKDDLKYTRSLNNLNSIQYAMGGQIQNGGFKNLPITQYKGNNHEQGGIALGNTNAEVEGNEVRVGDYIFSDRLLVPGKNISFSQEAKKLENKYKNIKGDNISKNSLIRELSQLAQSQEMVRNIKKEQENQLIQQQTQQMVPNEIQQNMQSEEVTQQFAFGGPFKRIFSDERESKSLKDLSNSIRDKERKIQEDFNSKNAGYLNDMTLSQEEKRLFDDKIRNMNKVKEISTYQHFLNTPENIRYYRSIGHNKEANTLNKLYNNFIDDILDDKKHKVNYGLLMNLNNARAKSLEQTYGTQNTIPVYTGEERQYKYAQGGPLERKKEELNQISQNLSENYIPPKEPDPNFNHKWYEFLYPGNIMRGVKQGLNYLGLRSPVKSSFGTPKVSKGVFAPLTNFINDMPEMIEYRTKSKENKLADRFINYSVQSDFYNKNKEFMEKEGENTIPYNKFNLRQSKLYNNPAYSDYQYALNNIDFLKDYYDRSNPEDNKKFRKSVDESMIDIAHNLSKNPNKFPEQLYDIVRKVSDLRNQAINNNAVSPYDTKSPAEILKEYDRNIEKQRKNPLTFIQEESEPYSESTDNLFIDATERDLKRFNSLQNPSNRKMLDLNPSMINKINKQRKYLQERFPSIYTNDLIDKKEYKDGGIYIKPEKRGTFTALANNYNMGVQEFANKVLNNKKDYNTSTIKKAVFAKNAAKWKHANGGFLDNDPYRYNSSLNNFLYYTNNSNANINNPIEDKYNNPNYGLTKQQLSQNILNSLNNPIGTQFNPINIGDVVVTANERRPVNTTLSNFNPTPEIKSFNNQTKNNEISEYGEVDDNTKQKLKLKFPKINWDNLFSNEKNTWNDIENTLSAIGADINEFLPYAVSNAGGLYDIYRGLQGGVPEYYGRLPYVNLNKLDPTQAIREIREQGNYAQNAVRNLGNMSYSQYLNNLNSIRQNTAKQVGNVVSQYDNANASILNQNKLQNLGTMEKNIQYDIAENDINARERDEAQNTLQKGLTAYGQGFNQYMIDKNSKTVQDQILKSMETTDFTYQTINNNGKKETIMVKKIKHPKTGELYSIDKNNNVYDVNGNYYSNLTDFIKS